jgi:2OG-Fe(II) oxygenase superfamily
MPAPRDRLAGLLGASAAPVAPCVQLTAKADDLRLEVEGVGRIRFPVPADQARQLIGRGVPARFGRGEETLTDPEVRDTWEVPRGLVRLDWTDALAGALTTVREQFGLPASCDLAADFHSLLVYEPGQFFLPHQDSEKHDTMIGTLVVTLPSAYSGGELVIHHSGESRTHRGWKRGLALVAFHADRRHEVRPVRSGYRIALTYNLLLEGEAGLPVAEDDTGVEELAQCLAQHFTTGVPHPYGEDRDPPTRLVYLLDHEYTERGLSWSRLKGVDIARGSRLQAAAQRANCEAVLALSDIQETWDADESEPDYRHHYQVDEDDAGTADDGEYEVRELIDSSVSLTRWIDQAGTSQNISLRVDDAEVCATTSSADLRPYSSQYEGYMGNYGNTLDRWYRRAAVVVWPSERSFANRAEAAPSWAIDQLLAQATAGDVAGARRAAATLAPFWDTVALPPDQGQLFLSVLRAADAVNDPQTAHLLVGRFLLEDLRVGHMAALAALAGRYGDAWVAERLREWFGRRESWSYGDQRDRMDWLTSLPEFCPALLTAGSSQPAATATHLLSLSWDSLSGHLRETLATRSPSHRTERLAGLGRSLAALLVAAATTGSADTREQAVEFCREHSDGLTACLISALRAAPTHVPDSHPAAGLDDLAAECARSLRARMSQPVRSDDDWSLNLPDGCTCELCQTLGAFLRDPTRRTFEWPLAERRRQHIHSRIDAHELPVSHRTRRSGRPYTLVLTKEPQLFEHERQARLMDQRDLDWLTTKWSPLC